MNFKSLHSRVTPVVVAASALLAAAPAWASGSGMPWESPIQKVVSSITGPVAQGVAVLSVTVFGLAVAFAASSFFLSFFGFAGGAEIR